jgi:hypothetical protein
MVFAASDLSLDHEVPKEKVLGEHILDIGVDLCDCVFTAQI